MEEVLLKTWGAALIAKVKTAISGKVDKVNGKGLSTNDFTTALKNSYDSAVTDVGNLKKAGYEKNVIVGVKVNGTALVPDSTRNVDVTVPTNAQIAQQIEGYEYQTAADVEKTVTSKGFQTAANVKSTVEGYNYQTAAQVETKITGKGYQTAAQVQSAINSALAGVTGIDIKVVESLPTTGSKGIIYLVAHSHGSGDNYDEYVWVADKSAYEKIGNTDVDLSGYLQKDDIVGLTESDLNTMWGT